MGPRTTGSALLSRVNRHDYVWCDVSASFGGLEVDVESLCASSFRLSGCSGAVLFSGIRETMSIFWA